MTASTDQHACPTTQLILATRCAHTEDVPTPRTCPHRGRAHTEDVAVAFLPVDPSILTQAHQTAGHSHTGTPCSRRHTILMQGHHSHAGTPFSRRDTILTQAHHSHAGTPNCRRCPGCQG